LSPLVPQYGNLPDHCLFLKREMSYSCMMKHCFWILLLISMPFWGQAQLTPKSLAIDSLPLSLNFGISVLAEQLPENVAYNPVIFLPKLRLWDFGKVSIYTEGQFTVAPSGVRKDANFEFGLNAGVQFRQHLFSGLALNALMGFGPHYITLESRQQATGFIFSDNVEIGFSYPLIRWNTEILLKGRFRHISNAGLNEPNRGLDNFFIVFGMGGRW